MQNQAIIPTSTKRSYKSAGTHWITTIPTDWRMQRVKSLLGERNERGHPSEPLLAATQSQGVVLKEKYDSRTVLPSNEVDQFKLVREGDFVISLRSFQGGIEYTYDQGIISPAYTVIYPYNPLTRDYFARLFKSRPFVQNLATCVTGIREGQNIDYTRLQVQTIPVPPPDEQAAIARFLDHADDQIQRYIAVKERLIALLEEERQAVIHQAVTRGLDPNVRLKPSGVEWLGEVPEHWEIRRLKSLVSIQTGGQDTINRKDDGKYPFFVRSQTVEKIDTWSYNGEAVLTAGDGAGVGKVFHYINGKFDFHQRVYKFSEFAGILGKLFFHSFKINLHQVVLQGTAKSTVDSLRLPMLQNFPIPLPPMEEQAAIVDFCEKNSADIEISIALAHRQIERMEEYRTRLIADVVTGQLDVREAAAQLPAAP